MSQPALIKQEKHARLGTGYAEGGYNAVPLGTAFRCQQEDDKFGDAQARKSSPEVMPAGRGQLRDSNGRQVWTLCMIT